MPRKRASGLIVGTYLCPVEGTRIPPELQVRRTRKNSPARGKVTHKTTLRFDQFVDIAETTFNQITRRNVTQRYAHATGSLVQVQIPADADIGYFQVPESSIRCFVSRVLVDGVLAQLNVLDNGTFSFRRYPSQAI